MPLQILVLTNRVGEAARFQTELAALGFAASVVESELTEDALQKVPALDLLLVDSCCIDSLASLRSIAPVLPMMMFVDGAEDHEVAMRWIRDGALDCLFSKSPEALHRAAYQALHLRGQREAARLASVERIRAFEAVVSACPFGICAVDENGAVMLWTAGAERITGWKQEEILGRTPPTIPPEHLQAFLEMVSLVVREGGQGWHLQELPQRHRDGSTFPMSITNSAMRDDNGKICGVVSILMDLTAREQLLAHTEAMRLDMSAARRYRDLLEAAPDAILEVDRHGRIVLANHSVKRLFGYEPEDLVGQPVEILVPDHLKGAHHHQRSSYMDAPSIRPMGNGLKLSARRADGSQFPVEITLSPMRFTEGMHVAAAVRDITERERLSEDVARSAQQAQMLFDAYPVPAYVYDRESLQFLAVNDQAAAEYGYSREEFLERTALDIRPVEDQPQFLAAVCGDRAAEGQVLRHLHKNGSLFDVHTVVHDIVMHGRAARMVVAYNITERRRREEELQEAKRKAEAASLSKSEFLASMSHELRSPLHTITGFSELLEEEIEGPLNEKQKRFVQHINRDSHHLLALINDILDLSKIEAGRLEFLTEDFDANSVVEEVLGTIRPQADAKAITMLNTLPADIVLRADRLRFKQIVLNLFSNAVKFTPHNGQIGIAASWFRDQLAFTVWDTGIGIPREHSDAVFDVFYQAGTTTKGVREGTGLGLSISKRLVEQQGGQIWLESEPGRGSRFTFSMPTPQAPPDRARLPVVLIIEEDPGRTRLLVQELEPAGYKVVFANSARDAAAKAIKLQPYAILLDLVLPSGKGWETFEYLKSLPSTENIPVIVISVLPSNSAADFGAAVYFTRPVSKGTLLQALRQHVDVTRENALVLVVDDEPAGLELAREVLESAGYESLLASSGREALERLAQRMPAAILVDLMMPDMNGFELIFRLKSDARYSNIPLLVLTGFALNKSDVDLLQRTTCAILIKGTAWKAELLLQLARLKGSG